MSLDSKFAFNGPYFVVLPCSGKVVEGGYTNWGRDEPNNFLNSQDCVLMHKDDRWGWRDFQCTAVEQYSYICQYGMYV